MKKITCLASIAISLLLLVAICGCGNAKKRYATEAKEQREKVTRIKKGDSEETVRQILGTPDSEDVRFFRGLVDHKAWFYKIGKNQEGGLLTVVLRPKVKGRMPGYAVDPSDIDGYGVTHVYGSYSDIIGIITFIERND